MIQQNLSEITMSIQFEKLVNANIANLQPYIPGKPIEELQRELGLDKIIKLASNENPLGSSPLASQAVRACADELSIYPDGSCYNLKLALAKHLQIQAENLTIGNGSDTLFPLIAQCFVPAGQSILISEYSFISYSLTAKIAQANLIQAPTKDYGCDLQAMLDHIQADVRVIFIANPNNPTGTWLCERKLIEFLNELPQNIIVVLDEAYYEYACIQENTYPNSLELLQLYPNLIITRTFSKAYGLAGLRVGYAISHPEVADYLNRVRKPFNVSSAAQVAACAALEDQEFVKQSIEINKQGKQQWYPALEKLELNYLDSPGNFLTVDLQRDAKPVYQDLLQQGVIVRPLANYNMPQHLRISIGLPEENSIAIQALTQSLTSK